MKNGYCCTTGCEFERETLFGCCSHLFYYVSQTHNVLFFGKREIIDQLCSLYLHCLVGFSSVDRRERERERGREGGSTATFPLSWAASSGRLSVGQGLAFVFVLTE
jgi:hypothetical protein